MEQQKKACGLKNTNAHAVVEATILFPIIMLVFAGLFLLSVYLPTRAILQRATQYAADGIATARSEGIASPIFAIASVLAIITMHDAMGVRYETGEQAKVLNQMIEQWIDVSEKNAPLLQNLHLKEMVGHTPLQVVAGVVVGVFVGFLYPMSLV